MKNNTTIIQSENELIKEILNDLWFTTDLKTISSYQKSKMYKQSILEKLKTVLKNECATDFDDFPQALKFKLILICEFYRIAFQNHKKLHYSSFDNSVIHMLWWLINSHMHVHNISDKNCILLWETIQPILNTVDVLEITDYASLWTWKKLFWILDDLIEFFNFSYLVHYTKYFLLMKPLPHIPYNDQYHLPNILREVIPNYGDFHGDYWIDNLMVDALDVPISSDQERVDFIDLARDTFIGHIPDEIVAKKMVSELSHYICPDRDKITFYTDENAGDLEDLLDEWEEEMDDYGI
ncbi:hypothetical protein LNTAR_10211 [Lentisphaera araneosa HTCC2155]|uniref:Uncharacterized protein n=1 Tax=Lentisphaera araneosa HTCC2155 TaxID=313628 RepID=A6DIJ5_9BACT|nr:hypothetical protein [Lentisphaera araneosa]EDM28281.1 hypothetical protein LNTAR_10211 [Lentisphaera araneosa HTCC2155]